MKNQAAQTNTFTASHEDISNRARELWESYGRPADRDQEIWLEAERQLLGVDSSIEAQGAASVPARDFDQATSQGKPRTRVEKTPVVKKPSTSAPARAAKR